MSDNNQEMHVCVKCEYCRTGDICKRFCSKNIEYIDVVDGRKLYKPCNLVRNGMLTCKDYKEISVEFKNTSKGKSFLERLKSMRNG